MARLGYAVAVSKGVAAGGHDAACRVEVDSLMHTRHLRRISAGSRMVVINL